VYKFLHSLVCVHACIHALTCRHVNAPFSFICELLGEAAAGLHTMRDEHFGISVVEYMAAGAVPVPPHSGGGGWGGGGGVNRSGMRTFQSWQFSGCRNARSRSPQLRAAFVCDSGSREYDMNC
jgi:hypothetical protein